MRIAIKFCLLVTLLTSATANAATIIGAANVYNNTPGDRSAAVDIGNIIDQSGLSSGYTSGVTDFDTYLGGNPEHTLDALDNEWFASSGVTSGIVDFDLGGVYSLDRIAVWNEDAAGVSSVDIFRCLFKVGKSSPGFSIKSEPGGISRYLSPVTNLQIPLEMPSDNQAYAVEPQ